MEIQSISDKDLKWIQSLLCERWGSTKIVTRGEIHNADQLPGFIAFNPDGRPVGLITYKIQNCDCEIITLDSLEPKKGVGIKLIKSTIDLANTKNCRRIWLVTTNDNMNALRFYQKAGFHMVKIHKEAIEKSRMLKPEIPQIGYDDIPIRDEIEMEIRL